eukprot:5277475-Lingulodinium_polyedra.AAC.1
MERKLFITTLGIDLLQSVAWETWAPLHHASTLRKNSQHYCAPLPAQHHAGLVARKGGLTVHH